MKKILIATCGECPYKYTEVNYFASPWPRISAVCSIIGARLDDKNLYVEVNKSCTLEENDIGNI